MNPTNENVFRAVFGILWLLYFGVRLYFQRKVRRSAIKYVTTNEKQEKFFFLLFALAYLILPVYCITRWVDFAHIPMPIWPRWTGAIIACTGIVLFAWTHHVLGINWTAILALSEKHKLVTSGPYRYVRHPMYTAFFLIGFGLFLLSANWLIGIMYIGTLSLMYIARVFTEEKMMIDRFGDDYRNYIKTTGRILPRLRHKG